MGTSRTWTKKNTTRRSQALCCCVPRTYSIGTKINWQWGVELLVIVFMGLVTLEQKNAQWQRAELLVVVAMRTSCIWIKKHDEHFIVVSMGFITLEQKKHDEHFIVVSLGFITLEQKKHDDEELSSSSSCAWLIYNIRTKEHNNNEMSSLLSWPWGPPTLQQKKNHDGEELNSSLFCPWDL